MATLTLVSNPKSAMKMFRKQLYVIFSTAMLTCLSSTTVLAGEQISVDRTLNWSAQTRTFTTESQFSGESFHFDGAAFNFNNTTVLPEYGESFAITSTASIQVRIENAIYEPVTTIGGKLIESIKPQLSNQIDIKYQVGYAQKAPQLDVYFVPMRVNASTGKIEKLVQFTLVITTSGNISYKTTDEDEFGDGSVLASGSWYKVSVVREGIFKIDRNWLNSNGISGTVSFDNFGVFGNGGGMLPESNAAFRYDDLQENAIYKKDVNGNGLFDDGDYIYFFGQAPHRWNYNEATNKFTHANNLYSDQTYYFITPDAGSGKYITDKTSEATENISTSSYDYLTFYDTDKINLLNSGRKWYAEVIDIYNPNRSYNFVMPGLITSEIVNIRASAAGSSLSGSTILKMDANGISLPTNIIVSELVEGFNETFAYESAIETGFTSTSENITIGVEFSGASVNTTWMNYIELLGRANLKHNNAQLYFRDSRTRADGNITKYILDADNDIKIWDVTNQINVQNQLFVEEGGDIIFRASSDTLRNFIAFTDADVFPSSSIIFVEKIANQNIHGITTQPDYVIVTHPAFLSEARRLAGFHHDTQGLDTMVVSIYDVYNEFSSGAQDISAIRDMMRMFYERAGADATKMPRYLLLFGDASFDYRYLAFDEEKNTLKIPNYESVESLSRGVSYGTDDFFGFLDPTEGDNIEDTAEKLDIGVGRLPVMTAEEATQMVDKIIHYKSEESLGSWRNGLCFLADDEDYNQHMKDADLLATTLKNDYPVYNIDKIYFDAYQQIPGAGGERYPEVETSINTKMYSGSFIMNYLGHGNEQNWAQERVLSVDDINSWENYDKLPLFITATCSFSRYDNPDLRSAGELVLLNPTGGGIALVTTVRLVISSGNYDLNKNLLNQLFVKTDGQYPALGDAVKKGKNAVTTGATNNRKFILLGDPALVLNYPKYNVQTKTVNGYDVNVYVDTLKALSKVTITGEVTDESGVKLSDFNGTVYPAVYDKPVTINTLINDPTASGVGGWGPSQEFDFELQKNALYKGKASVVNGDFAFTFIVPKDISYNYGSGKLSYYAENGEEDANGYSASVIIGGTADNAPEDLDGPEVNVFMNDETFVFGGLTDENPVLLIKLNDNSGINALGNAVGHDITATLDEDQQTLIKLNDYYESDLDEYQSGVVAYPLSGIAEGRHTVAVKAWDVYNNSGDGYTEFVVAETADLALSHVLNYPNPFTTNTTFWFEHNRPGDVLDVKVEIFTVSGKRIKTIQQQVSTDGYRVDDISWDGLDEYGDAIGKGVYVYKLTVKAASDNSKANEFQKLVILK